ncbi:hypothetical protein DVS28_a2803 [Euzebya pacifica]|uniref:Uncharacterized protein n=1 Tax=Euzebya pacifica TaxID=1608957 RepID=A0A346XZ35_9ACTN|nr:hypothetical protein [Euzebya pacifica]AXV07482.1 hypothetical protein DVS28_a2803 [Euzebya pacifica]
MESPQREGIALTSFDRATADAVVAVLSRAGIPAWQDAEPDEYGDTVVRVPDGQRNAAMREMGSRMEEIADEIAAAPAPRASIGRADGPVHRDPDDVHDGPPLVMQRFRDLRVLIVVVLAPLLAVTIAGPFLPRSLRVVAFVVIVAAVGAVIWQRRRSR